MALYSVMVRGEGLWLPDGRWRWISLLRRSIERRFGFRATQVLEASSVEEAASRAQALLHKQARAMCVNRGDEPFRIYVEQVTPIDPAQEDLVQGGITFYSEGHNRVPA